MPNYNQIGIKFILDKIFFNNTYRKTNTSGDIRIILIKKNALGIVSKVLLYTKLYNGIHKVLTVPSISIFTEFIAPVNM